MIEEYFKELIKNEVIPLKKEITDLKTQLEILSRQAVKVDAVLTSSEVCEFLKIKRNTLYWYVQTGRLKKAKGTRNRYKLQDVINARDYKKYMDLSELEKL